MTSKPPFITVGICVKDCESTIGKVIESLAQQDYPHKRIELIFVDDGSKDKTSEIISNEITKLDMQIQVNRQKWKGLGFARNVVVDNAHGEYIIWVDGDMTLSKNFLTKQVIFMEQNSKVGIAKGKYGLLPESTLVADLENQYHVINDLKIEKENKRLSIGYIGTGGSIYRHIALKQSKGFDPSIKGAGEDMDVESRIKSKGWLISKTSAIFYEMRRKTWKGLWREYFWQGFGAHHFFRKTKSVNSNPDIKYNLFPPITILTQIFDSVIAYKLIYRKTVFLMPIHYIFKRIAWLFGYLKFCFRNTTH